MCVYVNVDCMFEAVRLSTYVDKSSDYKAPT